MLKHYSLLSDISGACVLTMTNSNFREAKNTKTYKLKITKKDGSSFMPFGSFADSNYKKLQNIADKINNVENIKEPLIILPCAPFFLRLCFGIPLSFFYFLVGLGIIFPKEMEPIIYNVLDFLFTLNGYQ